MADSTARIQAARRLFDSGQLALAEGELRAVLASEAGNADALVLLGIIAAKTNRAGEAVSLLESALEAQPDHYDALTWLAMTRRSLGDPSGAIVLLERVLQLSGNDPEVFGLLGICQLATGQAAAAAKSFQAVISLQPNAAQAYFNLGMAQRLQNHMAEGLESFRRALKLDPGHAENYLQVFKQLQQLSRWTEAIEVLEQGLKRHPNSILLAEALAVAHGRLGNGEQAETIFRRISESDPSAAQTFADWLQERGRFEESVQVLERSIAMRPVQGQAYRGLAEAKAFDLASTERMLEVLDHPDLDKKGRMHLSYALGKAYDYEGEYELAMHHFDAANAQAYRFYAASSTFDAVSTAEDPDIMAGVYSREVIERMRAFGSESARPIFIVGMIRSGTTLLDQIVSSHPSVASVGEQPFWNVEADRVHRKWRVSPDAADLAAMAEDYLRVVSGSNSSSERVSDKMPLNFRHLGLIHVAFPRAKILHIRRNPLDTCLSIYTTFFAGGPNFTYNQDNIVAYYRSYLRFMDYWRSVLPSQSFHEVDYESLVGDPEPAIRSLIEFCGLPWSDACLYHDANPGAVTTPSRWQARQPIYTSSVERWRRYEPWLGSLLSLR